ncbi:MAG: hypothetical protein GY953_31105, partial [bacterium]|nr:hypothetical protein [bacterium]
AIAAPPEANNPEGALTYGLIWLDYLRRNQTHLSVEGLAVFLPEGHERTTCLRIRHLNPHAARYEVFVYSKDAYEERIDPRDHGNLETRLETCRTAVTERLAANSILNAVLRLPAVDSVLAPDGSLSLRVRGLEFARFHEHGLEFGIHRKRTAGDGDQREIELVVAELDRSRSSSTADRRHPLYSSLPEAWLESRVRAA